MIDWQLVPLWIGGVLLACAVISAWPHAPFFVRALAPPALCAAAFVAYLVIPQAFGFPVNAAWPPRGKIIALVPHDRERLLDAWIVADGSDAPRAYRIPMTERTKQQAGEAQKRIKAGGPAYYDTNYKMLTGQEFVIRDPELPKKDGE